MLMLFCSHISPSGLVCWTEDASVLLLMLTPHAIALRMLLDLAHFDEADETLHTFVVLRSGLC